MSLLDRFWFLFFTLALVAFLYVAIPTVYYLVKDVGYFLGQYSLFYEGLIEKFNLFWERVL